MEAIKKLAKEIKNMLNDGIDNESSLFLSEIIYDFYSWHIGTHNKIEFKNKAELKKAIEDFITMRGGS